MDTSKLIDYRNIKLWEYLNSKFNITLIETKSEFAHCNSINNDVQFFINPETSTSSCFTHELLHIWLRDLNIFIGASLKNSIRDNIKIRKIITESLIEQIGNWFDHIKMFPKFIELGYDRKMFLYDNDLIKLTEKEAIKIKREFRDGGKINPKTVDYYIGKYISSKADVSSDYDYSKNLDILKYTDIELFSSLEKIWKKWNEIDIYSNDIMKPNYHDVVFLFEYELEKWIENKRIE